MALGIPPQLASIEKEVQGIFKFLATGFQRIDKIKDAGRQSKHLEELSARMRGAKSRIKEFDVEIKVEEGKINPEFNKLLTEKKQFMITERNSYVAKRRTYTSLIGNRQESLDKDSHAGSAQDADVCVASSWLSPRLHALHFFLSCFSCQKQIL
ncbi:novel plant SNARE 13 [Physcomitrium patens]|uniref:Uncharacterized protein n=1 Tax=Physcomitrium patens TaxID=3218 RepID=A0A2K1IBC7_PHYPA|nr:novel plant SNARE 13-like [Physcomitrium patens]PNR26592.1 hypothetical protein PHYPA_030073 [Physcomitrium patens]|eukprot:XP_024366291.1 novel plant SNARE 13-like [Physcomitrella patens]